MDRTPRPRLDINSRSVQRWLERKIKESVNRSIREMTERLRAERAASGCPGEHGEGPSPVGSGPSIH